MAEPFLSEIRIMSFGFAPKGWALCNGQLLPINQNQALFSLLGTIYGGNGQTTFALPDLQARVPIHDGSGGFSPIGNRGGEQNHTLTMSELPTHTHAFNASTGAAVANTGPANSYLAQSSGVFLYGAASNVGAMSPNAIGTAGGSQPHTNMQPYLVLNFCIALQGIFPSRN